MNPTRRRLWLAVGAVALVQSAVLGSMVWDRVQLLKHGREIVLPIVPVDPRSLFRGDYVRLDYGLSRVPGHLIEGSPGRGAAVYVTIARVDGVWTPVRAATTPDSTGAADTGAAELIMLAAELIMLKGHGKPIDDGRNWSVRYGIESYFVPEGKGRELEALARDKKLAAVVAVDGGGHAAIKGLMIDGKLAYEEPLF